MREESVRPGTGAERDCVTDGRGGRRLGQLHKTRGFDANASARGTLP